MSNTQYTQCIVDEIEESLAKQFQKTMDFEILCDIMSRFGYHVIILKSYDPNNRDILRDWAEANFTGTWLEHLGTWLIELPSDATMFTLKWA